MIPSDEEKKAALETAMEVLQECAKVDESAIEISKSVRDGLMGILKTDEDMRKRGKNFITCSLEYLKEIRELRVATTTESRVTLDAMKSMTSFLNMPETKESIRQMKDLIEIIEKLKAFGNQDSIIKIVQAATEFTTNPPSTSKRMNG